MIRYMAESTTFQDAMPGSPLLVIASLIGLPPAFLIGYAAKRRIATRREFARLDQNRAAQSSNRMNMRVLIIRTLT
jgi:hypothetical protein